MCLRTALTVVLSVLLGLGVLLGPGLAAAPGTGQQSTSGNWTLEQQTDPFDDFVHLVATLRGEELPGFGPVLVLALSCPRDGVLEAFVGGPGIQPSGAVRLRFDAEQGFRQLWAPATLLELPSLVVPPYVVRVLGQYDVLLLEVAQTDGRPVRARFRLAGWERALDHLGASLPSRNCGGNAGGN